MITRIRRRAGTGLGVLLLAALAVTTVAPIAFVLVTAFKTVEQYGSEPLALPDPATFEFVRAAWDRAELGRALVNSLVVVAPAVALTVLVSVPAGYALAHVPFRGRGLALIGVIGVMTIPSAVLMIPLFRTVQQLGLLDSRLGLVLVYTSLFAPFGTYLIASNLRRFPLPVLEAAEMDGAGPLRLLTSIVLPLAMPAVATLVLLDFLWLWNELLFSLLLLQDPSKRTTTVALAALEGDLTTPVPLLAAGLLISIVPVLVVFGVSQRRLASAMVAGSVK